MLHISFWGREMNSVFSRVGGTAPHTQGLSLFFKTLFVLCRSLAGSFLLASLTRRNVAKILGDLFHTSIWEKARKKRLGTGETLC